MTENVDERMRLYQQERDLIQEKNNELKQKNKEIREFQNVIKEQNRKIAELTEENGKLMRNLNVIIENESKLKEKNEEIRQLLEANKKQITEKKAKNKKKKKPHKPAKKDTTVTAEQNTSVLIMKSDQIYLLDSGANCWKKLKITLPIPMKDSFGAVLVNGEIYIFGGRWNKLYCHNCYKLKADRTWMELAPLNEKRAYISNSSVVYFGEIWVIGGESEKMVFESDRIGFREKYNGDYERHYLRSVEKYNISQNKWIQMPDLNESRSGAAAAVYKNKIIVTGGFSGFESTEIFDPKVQKWILFCALPVSTANHCMTISDSILTIYGGSYDHTKVWEMDIEDSQKEWTKKQDLKYERRYFGLAKLSNGIMAIGGSGNDGTTEIFDGNNWIEGPSLPQKMSQFAYVAIPHSVEEDLLTKFS